MARIVVEKDEHNQGVQISHIGFSSVFIKKEALEPLIENLQKSLDSFPKPCVHAELIKQYAEDCQKYERPWELWAVNFKGTGWQPLYEHPRWGQSSTYRRKPV